MKLLSHINCFNGVYQALKNVRKLLNHILIIWQLSVCFGVFAEGVFNDSVVIFTNLYSNKVMSVDDFGCDKGSNVSQWELDKFLLNKLFVLIDVGEGYYKIRAFHCKDKFLESDGSSCENGTNVRLWSMDDNTDNKFWKLEKINPDSNSYIIYNRKCGKNQLVEVKNAENDNGANVRLWNDDGKLNKRWRIDTYPINPNTCNVWSRADGCSAPYPKITPYCETFKKACDFHDKCYSSCNCSKNNCDEQFKRLLLKSCAPLDSYCPEAAMLYYGIVKEKGQSSFI